MYLTPINTHLLAIFTTSIEVSYLICTEYIVHVLGKLCLQWSHNGELLANENLCKQLICACKYHCLLLEVLDEGTLCQELWHIAYLVLCLTRKHLTCTRKNCCYYEYRHIRQIRDKLLHKNQVLCTSIF